MLNLRYSQIIVAAGLFLLTTFMFSSNTFNSIGDKDKYTHQFADMFKGVVIAMLHVATFMFAFRIAQNQNVTSIKQVIKKGLKFFIGMGLLAAFCEYRLGSYTCLGEECLGVMVLSPILFIGLPIIGLVSGVFYYVLIKKGKLVYFLSVFLLFAVIVFINLVKNWDSDCPIHGQHDRLGCLENKAIATKDYSVCKKLSGEYPEICLTGIAKKLKNPSIYSCASDRRRETKYSCLNDFLR